MEWNWHSFLLNFQIDIHGLANPEEGSSGNRTGVKASRGGPTFTQFWLCCRLIPISKGHEEVLSINH